MSSLTSDEATLADITLQMTPAQRVFAIPELLEIILIHIAKSGEPMCRSVVPQLFQLQQVNSTIQELLNRSKTLRQHMWLTPFALLDCCRSTYCPARTHGYESPSVRFLGELMKMEYRSSISAGQTNIMLYDYTVVGKDFPPGFAGDRPASWKKMLAVPFLHAGKRILNLEISTDTADWERGLFLLFSTCHVSLDLGSADLDGDVTLGALFDKYRKITQGVRGQRVQRHAKETMEAWYGKKYTVAQEIV